MERYQQLFKQLAAKKEGAFVPFVQLGDPSPAMSLNIIDTLIAAGADALELGIPFSECGVACLCCGCHSGYLF